MRRYKNFNFKLGYAFLKSGQNTLFTYNTFNKRKYSQAKAKEDPASFMSALKAKKLSDTEWQFTIEKDFPLHNLQSGPSKEVKTTRAELLSFYKQMQLIRQVENISNNMYRKQQIRGFLHIYSGQEAVAIGMESALTFNDSIITAYRDHGHALARGETAKTVLGELVGKLAGCSKGKGGSMHMYNKKTNFYGGNGIVGAQVPVGAGLAFANKILKNGHVCVTLYGDGAANQGQVFEAFNMAKLWKLPCIFVCENNHYAMGTEAFRAAANLNFYARGDYIPGIRVDGMDVLAVKSASKFAVDFVKKEGPILLEMETYRYEGHSMSDPGTTYRTTDEITKTRKSRDPIAQTKLRLIINQMAKEEELQEIDDAIKKEVQEASEFALQTEWPPEEELYLDIMKEKVPVRAVELEKSYVPK